MQFIYIKTFVIVFIVRFATSFSMYSNFCIVQIAICAIYGNFCMTHCATSVMYTNFCNVCRRIALIQIRNFKNMYSKRASLSRLTLNQRALMFK